MRFLLLPLTLIYGLVIWVRNRLYDMGYLKAQSVSKPTLCVGNLTAGGTGKTPWTALIADRLVGQGKKVAILSRGYKGDFEGVLKVTSQTEPYICGDEPFWLFKNTRAAVFVGADRYAVASFALSEGDYDILLMDDGYQHRALKRNKNILVFDASAASWRYWLLPAGRMRESMAGARRAQVCILNKWNMASEESKSRVEKKVAPYFSASQVVKSNYVFDQWFPLFDDLHKEMKKEAVALACGIANPESFIKTAEDSGLSLKDRFVFVDHYSWPIREIERLCHLMKQQKIVDLLITEKDAIKLSRYRNYFLQVGIQLWVCKMKLDVLEGEEALDSLLQDLVEEKGKKWLN